MVPANRSATAMSNRQSTRPRRIDDALSQLIDSLTPPLTLSNLTEEEYTTSSDPEDLLAAAEENRHHAHLARAWQVLDSHATPTANDLSLPIGPAGYGIRNLADGNINNASDLIKRKLLRGNAGPDRALRFSNLYSRLLTQPVLSQKWGILYLLSRLSVIGGGAEDFQIEEGEEEEDEGMVEEGQDHSDEELVDEGEDAGRSPLMGSGNLQQMMLNGRQQRTRRDLSDEEGPAVSSSASQRPPRPSTRGEADQEHRDNRSRPTTATRRNPMDEQQISPSTSRPSSSKGYPRTPEYGLLRDLPYNLQGLSSTNLEFSSSSTLKLPAELPIPMVSLLNALAEPCLLYRGLASFVDSSDGGLISQSLRAALSNELRSYLGLVATLETEIRRALAAPGDPSEPGGMLKGGVTLKRCVVWTRDATMALRLMSLIVEEARSMF